ncbi:MAG: hypothetical protein U1E06_11290 [Tabrizicola sp.]|uniref:hypothetical protein n=1 Tax=Tabrizicola sp. TaxID=2005166 RepID=UPI002736BDEF|nr:hypothetical protein [Tabrizicola sp.]MDP3264223.1 hypothetical protein [Tabrizicola sp.]MDZ4067411.1 hypothetical protein [Tabrizicola sp.]
MSKITALVPRRPYRMSPRIREAVSLMVRKGATEAAAAEAAGLTARGLKKALRRPEVIALAAQIHKDLPSEIEQLLVLARATAYRTAVDLMQTSKNERIRERMVALLARGDLSDVRTDGAKAGNADRAPAGYTYTRPVQ